MDKVVIYNVGLYCRLSLDDGNVGESGSIQTQKIILSKYAKDNETKLYWVSSHYYSPEFWRVIQPVDVLTLNPLSINGLNLYSYANNNPIVIAYSSSNIGGTGSCRMVSSLALSIGSFNSRYHDAISNSSKWQFNPNFLTDMFGNIENGEIYKYLGSSVYAEYDKIYKKVKK